MAEKDKDKADEPEKAPEGEELGSAESAESGEAPAFEQQGEAQTGVQPEEEDDIPEAGR